MFLVLQYWTCYQLNTVISKIDICIISSNHKIGWCFILSLQVNKRVHEWTLQKLTNDGKEFNRVTTCTANGTTYYCLISNTFLLCVFVLWDYNCGLEMNTPPPKKTTNKQTKQKNYKKQSGFLWFEKKLTLSDFVSWIIKPALSYFFMFFTTSTWR